MSRVRLQPFGVLVEHRIDDVNERLVAREEAVPPGQQVAFQPALAHDARLRLPSLGRRAKGDRRLAGSSAGKDSVGHFEEQRPADLKRSRPDP